MSQTCDECKHYFYEGGFIAFCACPLPQIVASASTVIELDADATNCPCFERKDDE